MRRRLATMIVAIVLSAVLLVCIFRTDFGAEIYNSAYNWLGKKSGVDPYWPELRTNRDLWFKGYLGIFFGFDKFGSLNWLAIPLVVYFLITIKKRKRWEISLCLALGIAVIFICSLGYGWYRYQLTLFPLLIATIFLFGWQVLQEMNRRLSLGIMLFCICMLFAHSYSLKDTYAYYWQGSIGAGKAGERFPYDLIEYINNNVDGGSEIAEDGPPLLLYHVTKRRNVQGLGKGSYRLIRGGSLTAGYDLVYEDQGYRLYKKEDNLDQLYRTLYAPVFSKKSLVKNGSFEKWPVHRSPVPDFWHIYGTGSVQKEKSDKQVGDYALKITGDNFNFYQNIVLAGLAPDNKMSCFAWLKTAIPGKYRIQIYDGIDSSFSERHTGDGTWQLLRVVHPVNPGVKTLELRVIQAERTGGSNDVVSVDGVLLFPGEYYGPSAWLMEQDHALHSRPKNQRPDKLPGA